MNVRSVPFSGVRPGASSAWKSQQLLLLFQGWCQKKNSAHSLRSRCRRETPVSSLRVGSPGGGFNSSLLGALTSVQTHLSPTTDLFSFRLLTLCSKENGELLKDLKYMHEGERIKEVFSHYGNGAKNGKGWWQGWMKRIDRLIGRVGYHGSNGRRVLELARN